MSTPKLVNDDIRIECSKCGHIEETTVANFCRAKICPCKIHNRKTSFEDFKKMAHEIHNYKYKYSDKGYDSLLSYINIECPIHGQFTLQARPHIRKNNPTGCQKCSFEKISKDFTKPFSFFLSKAIATFGDLYEYDQTSYSGMAGDIIYNCKIHGKITQNISNFLRGNGCPSCFREKHAQDLAYDWEEVRKKLIGVNPSFIYPKKINYINCLQYIEIICSNGHKFKRQIKHHLANDHGCPFCSNKINKPMQEIADIVNEDHQFNVKPFDSSAQEIDIYYPDYRIGIEYHGLIFHAEGLNTPFQKKDRNYHLNKLNLANENGIKLIQIFEDEWIYNKEIVKNKLLYIFNKHVGKKIGARQCIIKAIDNKTSALFLERYHIQGKDIASINLGAFYNNDLVEL